MGNIFYAAAIGLSAYVAAVVTLVGMGLAESISRAHERAKREAVRGGDQYGRRLAPLGIRREISDMESKRRNTESTSDVRQKSVSLDQLSR
jgi:hypothetical protein